METEERIASLREVEQTREERLYKSYPRMNKSEKRTVLEEYHPDYVESACETLRLGVNKGDKVIKEFASLLYGKPIISDKVINLDNPDYETDVLVIGGGGAGAAAAITAKERGADVLIVTKLRMGDSNTVMAEGGIQAADGPNDSPVTHYIDAFGGGGYAAKPQLLKKLVLEAPEAIAWLTGLGVVFDKNADGEPVTSHGGGTSKKRMHACRDFTGLEIMRTLKSEVACKGIPVAEYSFAVEIIKDENGNAAGAVLANTETGGLSVVKAKTVIIATGGAGRLHCQGFPTSNHYGATADGLAIAYRAGAKLICADTLQYHPTGVAEPSRMLGALVTEKVRALGAQLVNKNGEAFVNPLEPRDVTAAAIIRECKLGNGIKTANGFGVWLDTPMIEIVNGEGTIEKRLPSTFSTFEKAGIDIRKEPILVYPTLHYQNGGIEIDENCEAVGVKNLFACGEAAGGIHGRNRLMGNSLADIIVFGKTAGMVAAERSKDIRVGKLTLEHVEDFEKELEKAGVKTAEFSPRILPDYIYPQDQS